jgi:hypothetical protein
MTSEKVHHHAFANPAVLSAFEAQAGRSTLTEILEDDFLTLEGLVSYKNAATERRLKQVLADIEEMMRENRWEGVKIMTNLI